MTLAGSFFVTFIALELPLLRVHQVSKSEIFNYSGIE